MAVLRSERGGTIRVVLSYGRYRQALDYLTEAEAGVLAVRFARAVSLPGEGETRGIDFQVEIILDDISLYFRLIDALALAHENRKRRGGGLGDSASDRLSRM